MNKKETTNSKELKNQNYEAKKMNNSSNLKKKKDKDLPWWVELLFVQIGLPDKLLVKILKAKKTSNEFIKNKNTIGINNREIKMLSTNFCYGGEEIYEIENLKN